MTPEQAERMLAAGVAWGLSTSPIFQKWNRGVM